MPLSLGRHLAERETALVPCAANIGGRTVEPCGPVA